MAICLEQLKTNKICLLCCFGLILTTLAITLFCKYHTRLQEKTEVNNATLSKITPNTTISFVNISKLQNNEDLLVTLAKPVYLQYKIIEEKKDKANVKSIRSKPVKGYSRQLSSSTCNDKADLKFIEFIKAFVGETNAYKSLNWKIDYLHCKFFNLISDKSNSQVACRTNPTTVLSFKNNNALFKLKDYNKKDENSLFDYTQLLSQFLPSLLLIETTMATAKLYRNEIQFIRNGLIQMQKAMIQTRKEITKCSIKSTLKTMKLPAIVLPFNDRVTQLRFTEEERAMAIFKQLQFVFRVMKEDLTHRRRCVN